MNSGNRIARRAAAWALVAISLTLLACGGGGREEIAVGSARDAMDRPQDGRVYVPMPDGTEIAVYLQFPPGWDGQSRLPVILQYDGYEGGGGPAWEGTGLDPDHYVLAHAGVRGAGCSGGQWDFHSEQEARDGAVVVDWLGTQPWSTGNVGMSGHSYPAHMAILTAAQRPRHLRAIAVSGTGDSLYRDFSYPGGVPNKFVGIYWGVFARPYDSEYAALEELYYGRSDCFEHTISRQERGDGLLQAAVAYLDDEDNYYWNSRSPGAVIHQVNVPVLINAATGDEWVPGSTNGSAYMFQKLPSDNKQLIITNGSHGSFFLQASVTNARKAWFDRWLRGIHNGTDEAPRVRVLLEAHYGSDAQLHETGEVASEDYPLDDSRWTRLYAGTGGTLTEQPPSQGGSDRFLLTPRRIGYFYTEAGEGQYVGQDLHQLNGPDEVNYRTEPAASNRVIAGPIVAKLFARIYSTDADVAVILQLEAADGSRSLLTKGYLRASHRAVDADRSGYDGELMYRVHHPHTNPQLLAPGEIVELDIQIAAAGVVLREGDVLRMQVAGVPLAEGLSIFTQKPPAVVEIVHGPESPTHLLVPFVDAPPDLEERPACGSQSAVFCGYGLGESGTPSLNRSLK